MVMLKRQQFFNQIKEIVGQSLTDDQQRRLESSKDVGDQAMMDLERELGISLLEMQNWEGQLIDEALIRLAEGAYGVCADCGAENQRTAPGSGAVCEALCRVPISAGID